MLSCCRTRNVYSLRSIVFPSSAKLNEVIRGAQPVIVAFQTRALSTRDVFGTMDLSLAENFSKIPAMPTPLPKQLSVEELYQSGKSVVDELGLFSWWKPSGYLRYALEYLHLHCDLPWWGTIMCGTLVLRLLLIYVPIMAQKFAARQSQFAPELREFNERLQEAKRENNMMLIQQILMEQRDFMHTNDIRYARQFVFLGANATVFLTQFFAIKKMVNVGYPGLSTGGVLWFTDLTACDPYYLLPVISACTMAMVMKLGTESGQSTDMMPPVMRMGMLYGLPIVVLISSSQFASALCLYWCTSNFISLSYAYIFRIPAVRNALSLPAIKKPEKKVENSLSAVWKNFQASRTAPPSIESLRAKDAKQFKKAGRGKPVIKMD